MSIALYEVALAILIRFTGGDEPCQDDATPLVAVVKARRSDACCVA